MASAMLEYLLLISEYAHGTAENVKSLFADIPNLHKLRRIEKSGRNLSYREPADLSIGILQNKKTIWFLCIIFLPALHSKRRRRVLPVAARWGTLKRVLRRRKSDDALSGLPTQPSTLDSHFERPLSSSPATKTGTSSAGSPLDSHLRTRSARASWARRRQQKRGQAQRALYSTPNCGLSLQ